VKRSASSFFLLFILCLALVSLLKINVAKAEPKTIVVPDDYSKIEWAIGNASKGDTIFVRKGTYHNVSLQINKSLSLIGEDSRTTILRGLNLVFPYMSIVIQIKANDIKISGFTVTHDEFGVTGNGDRTQIIGNNITGIYANAISLGGSYNTIAQNNITGALRCIHCGGSFNTITENNIINAHNKGIDLRGSSNTISENHIIEHHSNGITLENADSNTISNNTIIHGTEGIKLQTSSQNTVFGNIIERHALWGIVLNEAYHNVVYENYIANNRGDNAGYGVALGGNSYHLENNTFYRNTFLNNSYPVWIETLGYINFWDNGEEGNYWDDYTGIDSNGDGIGDTSYVIDENNQDNYPLIHPYGSIRNLDTNLTCLTIQAAIDAPQTLDGHTILVDAGTYHEHVTINKSISLIGENRSTTIIDGNRSGTPIKILSNNVIVSGFTIRNSSTSYPHQNGIYILSNGCLISNNIITNNYWAGILISAAPDNTIINNVIINNHKGIEIFFGSPLGNNTISNNTIALNDWYGIYIVYSSENKIYLNNFTDNRNQTYSTGSTNFWDDGVGKGNYWSDYEDRYPDAEEINGSGIWDTPYVIYSTTGAQQDNYPLVPEFPTWAMLLLLVVLTVVTAIYRRRLLKTPIH
jgi:parallel beta-helix repeat protein